MKNEEINEKSYLKKVIWKKFLKKVFKKDFNTNFFLYVNSQMKNTETWLKN